MFEKRKLQKYADYVIGFAYEQSFCDVRVYLVLYIDKLIIKSYSNKFFLTKKVADEYIQHLVIQGYKPLDYYIQKNQEIKKKTLKGD